MPPKKKVDLPDHVRAAVLADVETDYLAAISADEKYKIRIYLAIQQGTDTYEIADKLHVSQSVVSKWSRQGREALELREEGARESAGDPSSGEDPVRSGEREPVG